MAVLDRYGNQEYSGGEPVKLGDRYYVFDHVRDWWYQMDKVGRVLTDVYGNLDVVVSGGEVSEGSDAEKIDISETVAYCQFEVTVPADGQVPTGSTETSMVSALRVVLPAQTDYDISGATLDDSTTNYVKVKYSEAAVFNRDRAFASGSYDFAVEGEAELVVDDSSPSDGEALLATFTGDGSTLTIEQEYSAGRPITRETRTPSVTSFPTATHIGEEVWRSDLEKFFKWNGSDWMEI